MCCDGSLACILSCKGQLPWAGEYILHKIQFILSVTLNNECSSEENAKVLFFFFLIPVSKIGTESLFKS